MKKAPDIAIVILAAGKGRRMGRTKQLLPWGEGTLVEHAIQNALASEAGEVYIVLGAVAEIIAKRVNHLPVQQVWNPNWESGMGSSLKAGLEALPRTCDAALFMLVDQPAVNRDHLDAERV